MYSFTKCFIAFCIQHLKVNGLFTDSWKAESIVAEKPLLCMIKSYEETAVFRIKYLPSIIPLQTWLFVMDVFISFKWRAVFSFRQRCIFTIIRKFKIFVTITIWTTLPKCIISNATSLAWARVTLLCRVCMAEQIKTCVAYPLFWCLILRHLSC